MNFTQISSGVMMLASLALAVAYGGHLAGAWQDAQGVPVPDAGFIRHIAVLFVIAVIIGHIVVGIIFNRQAAEGEDERDWAIIYKAGGVSGSFLGFCIAGGLWFALSRGNSDILVHYAVMGLILASFINYACRLVFYRRGL